MLLKTVSAAIALMAAFSIQAEVQVEDRSPVGTSMPPPMNTQKSASSASAQQNAEMYYQLQLLQQEVQTLRGIVEQQSHELKRLKQQRLDDYLELDRRLSALGQGGVSQAEDDQAPVRNNSGASAAAPQDELKHYRSAIDLVLKQQEYDQAIVKLQEHLARYPDGRYAGNAVYWLGEIYLLKNDLEQSRQWFVQLIDNYPSHRKVPDGKFKLGKVYHLMGNDNQAKTLLNEVAASNSDAASLAKAYLQDNFSS